MELSTEPKATSWRGEGPSGGSARWRWGLRQKGRIQIGAVVDIVVFDLATVQVNATFAEPAQRSTGFRRVRVNGAPVIQHGQEILEARPGRPAGRPDQGLSSRGPGPGARV